MESGLNIEQHVGVKLHRTANVVENKLRWKNPFSAMHFRKGKNGLYELIDIINGMNDVTIEGKNHLLDVVFGNSTPVTQVNPWYIGLIDQSPVPTLAEADTLASHSGWNEFTSYAANRKAWDDTNAASKVKGSTTTSDFTINASGDVHGIMIASVATGTSGVLWASGSFDASVAVVNTDVMKITYGVRT